MTRKLGGREVNAYEYKQIWISRIAILWIPAGFWLPAYPSMRRLVVH